MMESVELVKKLVERENYEVHEEKIHLIGDDHIDLKLFISPVVIPGTQANLDLDDIWEPLHHIANSAGFYIVGLGLPNEENQMELTLVGHEFVQSFVKSLKGLLDVLKNEYLVIQGHDDLIQAYTQLAFVHLDAKQLNIEFEDPTWNKVYPERCQDDEEDRLTTLRAYRGLFKRLLFHLDELETIGEEFKVDWNIESYRRLCVLRVPR